MQVEDGTDANPTKEPASSSSHNAVHELSALAKGGVDIARGLLELVAIELELAARSLVLLIVLAIGLAAVAVLVWTLVLASIGAYLHHGPGLTLSSTFAVLALLNVTVGAVLWIAVQRLAGRLGLPAVRHFLGTSENAPEAGGEQ
jgi:hypothetical protein